MSKALNPKEALKDNCNKKGSLQTKSRGNGILRFIAVGLYAYTQPEVLTENN